MYKDAVAGTEQRLKMPIVSAFITTWLILNWKFSILFLKGVTSKMTGAELTTLIETYIRDHPFSVSLLPLLYAASVLVFLEAVNLALKFVTQWPRDQQTKLENKETRPGTEYTELHTQHLEEQVAHNKTKETLREAQRDLLDSITFRTKQEKKIERKEKENQALLKEKHESQTRYDTLDHRARIRKDKLEEWYDLRDNLPILQEALISWKNGQNALNDEVEQNGK